MAVSHGSLPFQEQHDYFRGKVNVPTRSWTEIYTAEHDYAFVAASAVPTVSTVMATAHTRSPMASLWVLFLALRILTIGRV